MSENLDLVRSIYADWERGDFSVTGWADPDLLFGTLDGVSPGTTRGLAASGSAWREALRDYDEFRAHAEEYRELDGERVLVFHRFGGRGKRSGIGVDAMGSKGACLFHVVDAKVTKLLLYVERSNALADLGLEE